MAHSDILESGGAIARRLGTYEARPQQLAMADAVADAIATQRHLLVEAGTGVGKSFAYLVPAILAALADKECRVVISTHTISLQEQLIRKDLPFLQTVLPPFHAVLVKGRSNYLSLRRLRVAQQRASSLLADDAASGQLLDIGRWSRRTSDGSRSDLRFTPSPSVWDLVESDSNNCLGRNCPDYDKCFYFKARRQMTGAQVLVVNHALLCSDLALRRSGASILPKYQVAIIDEAHSFEDVAADHMGLQVARGQIDYLLGKLYTERRGVGHGLFMVHGDNAAMQQVLVVREAVELFFGAITAWRAGQQRRQGSESCRVRQPDIVPDSLSPELENVARAIDRLADGIKNDEEKIELEAAANRCLALADGLRTWLGQKLPDQVYWIDVSGERGQRIMLASSPIDVGPMLRELLYEKTPTVVLTSATLSVGGRTGFNYYQRRLGLDKAATLQQGSPFNYREQVELHLFRQMPDPSTVDFEAACMEKIKHYVQLSRGRAFVLFTSYQMMQRAATQLREWFRGQGMPLFSQGDGLPRSLMLEQFRTSGNGVLFGVDSFWQGVDVPGEALSNVIITKLPFQAPDRPIVEARCEALQAAGEVAFTAYQVPQAVIKLKQGFGRLIRSKGDRGLVVILDPRVLTKRYGQQFLDALPECRKFVDGESL